MGVISEMCMGIFRFRFGFGWMTLEYVGGVLCTFFGSYNEWQTVQQRGLMRGDFQPEIKY